MWNDVERIISLKLLIFLASKAKPSFSLVSNDLSSLSQLQKKTRLTHLLWLRDSKPLFGSLEIAMGHSHSFSSLMLTNTILNPLEPDSSLKTEEQLDQYSSKVFMSFGQRAPFRRQMRLVVAINKYTNQKKIENYTSLQLSNIHRSIPPFFSANQLPRTYKPKKTTCFCLVSQHVLFLPFVYPLILPGKTKKAWDRLINHPGNYRFLGQMTVKGRFPWPVGSLRLLLFFFSLLRRSMILHLISSIYLSAI